MPYAFAHPAAVVPLASLLGRRAVPSALAIGSMIPDAWYLVPGLGREDTHGVIGALLFCLPAGLFAYAAFHLIFKQPMLALAPRRLAARLLGWASPGLPAARWSAVILSLLVGIATHVAWDEATHEGEIARLFQHASTLIGTAFLAGWLWRKVSAAPPREPVHTLPRGARLAAWTLLAAVPGITFAAALAQFGADAFEVTTLRVALRAAGVMAAASFGLMALGFCVAWRFVCYEGIIPTDPRRSNR